MLCVLLCFVFLYGIQIRKFGAILIFLNERPKQLKQWRHAKDMLEEQKNVSIKLQKEEPEKKRVWQAVQLTGKNDLVTNT